MCSRLGLSILTAALSISAVYPLSSHDAWARKKTTSTAPAFDSKEVRNEGKKLYKQRSFKRAKRLFVQLVQHNATSAQDYTYLARSAMRAGDYLVASVAYLIYFELARKPKPKLRAEYREAKNHISEGMDKRKLSAHKQRLEEVLKLIKEDELHGSKGAFSAILDLHRDQIFHPLLRRAHQRFRRQLFRENERLASQLSKRKAEARELKTHKRTLKRWGERSWGDREAADRALESLQLLSQLESQPESVLDQKQAAELERRGLSKSELRKLQLKALLKLDRRREIYLMADGMTQGVGPDTTDIEALRRLQYLHLLRGVYGEPQMRAKALQDALSIPSLRARRALKLGRSTERSTAKRDAAAPPPR